MLNFEFHKKFINEFVFLKLHKSMNIFHDIGNTVYIYIYTYYATQRAYTCNFYHFPLQNMYCRYQGLKKMAVVYIVIARSLRKVLFC